MNNWHSLHNELKTKHFNWLNPESNPIEDLAFLTDYLQNRYNKEYTYLTCRRKLYDILRNHPKTIETFNHTFNITVDKLTPNQLKELFESKNILKDNIVLYDENYEFTEKIGYGDSKYHYTKCILDYKYIIVGTDKEYYVDDILKVTQYSSEPLSLVFGTGYFKVLDEDGEQHIECKEDITENKKFLCDVIVRWNGEPSHKFKCIVMKSNGRYYYFDGQDCKHEFDYFAYRELTNIQYL